MERRVTFEKDSSGEAIVLEETMEDGSVVFHKYYTENLIHLLYQIEERLIEVERKIEKLQK